MLGLMNREKLEMKTFCMPPQLHQMRILSNSFQNNRPSSSLQTASIPNLEEDSSRLGLGGGSAVKCIGQDDKAKVPMGDKMPVATGARSEHKAIVPADKDLNNNKAAGEDGEGEIFVTLKDATFHPSDIFENCAQLFMILEGKKVNCNISAASVDDTASVVDIIQ
eukprot:7194911-Ditylum_brightwellii.AAC.1